MNAKDAYEILSRKNFSLEPDVKNKLLDIVKKDSHYTYKYAEYVIQGRWFEGEEIIKTSLEYAYQYARSVIKGRWIEAEEIIKTCPAYSYRYAEDVIKGRWIEAEEIIRTNSDYAYLYARDVIKNNNFWEHKKLLENFTKDLKDLKEKKAIEVNPELDSLRKQREELDKKIKQLERV